MSNHFVFVLIILTIDLKWCVTRRHVWICSNICAYSAQAISMVLFGPFLDLNNVTFLLKISFCAPQKKERKSCVQNNIRVSKLWLKRPKRLLTTNILLEIS